MLQKRILLTASSVLVLVLIFGGGLWFGYDLGRQHPAVIRVEGVQDIQNPDSVQADFGPFWQAWKMIEDNYLRNSSTSGEARVDGAIRGLVGSLNDPYSEYFPAQDNKKFLEDVRGNFGGIGAELAIRKNQLTVVAPLKDTPASRAGLRAGDAILQVNSSSTDSISIDQAVQWIRGPQGSEVKLLIMREEWTKPKEFSILRDTIQIPTLDSEVKGDIVHLQLYGFNSNTNWLFYQAVAKALDQGAKGMVLDLRDNPGGYLDVAVDVAGWFLPNNALVVSEATRSGTAEELRANGNEALKDFPVVVLINKGSASASEILAGALRVDRGVKLVGEQSFGKGTVQQLLDMSDGAGLKLTIAHWVLPDGQILEGQGLKPDVEVKITDEDIAQKKDPQLDKALEIMQGLIQK